MAAGEAISFHLNLTIGSPATVYFRLVVSSPNIGTYNIPFSYSIGTPAQDETNTPVAFSIEGLYPNPVSGSAVFHLSSPKNIGAATIEIYNVKGQKVQSIFQPDIHSGINEIGFIPKVSLPNGVYYYRLQNSGRKAAKFILIR